MKKVLYVITKANWGGAQRYVYDLATHLPKEQFEVAVAFGQPGRLNDELRKAGITTHPLHSLQRDVSLGADLKSFFELRRLFKKEKPDVVHLNSSKAGGIGALAAHLAGVRKIIFTAHGWPFWEPRNFLARGVIWLLSWITAMLSDTTITVSDYDLRVAERMPFVGHKVVRVYNGVAPATATPYGTGYIGELNRNKGVDILLRALARTHGDLTIVGSGEEEEYLKQLARELGLKERVKFVGFVPNAGTAMPFETLILPSRKEGLPYVLLEAGARGSAVIATAVGGVPEIVHNEVTGLLVPPNNPKALAAAIERLNNDPTLRQQLGANLKQKIERDFSLAHMLDKTQALY